MDKTNRDIKYINRDFSDFQIINTSIPYCGGGTHFSEVMIKGLSMIEASKYVKENNIPY